MKAFVAMRRLLSASMPTLASLASRVEANERRQIEDQAKNERRFEEIHAKMSAGDVPNFLSRQVLGCEVAFGRAP